MTIGAVYLSIYFNYKSLKLSEKGQYKKLNLI